LIESLTGLAEELVGTDIFSLGIKGNAGAGCEAYGISANPDWLSGYIEEVPDR